MIIFILGNEDNSEDLGTESGEGIPQEGDSLTDQEQEVENTEEQTEQEQEFEQEEVQQTESVESVDSSALDVIKEQIDELTAYSFASCLLLSLIFLFSVIKSLFSGFR